MLRSSFTINMDAWGDSASVAHRKTHFSARESKRVLVRRNVIIEIGPIKYHYILRTLSN